MGWLNVKFVCAIAFGYHELHPGECCECCGGYCPCVEWNGAEPYEPMIRFTHAGREWITDRYISLTTEMLAGLPANVREQKSPTAAIWATKATGPATGTLGPKSLGLLERIPQLAVMDSDVESQHAFTLDGRMVGFAVKGRDWLPVEYLDRARLLANDLGAVGESALMLASRAIVSWLEITKDGAE